MALHLHHIPFGGLSPPMPSTVLLLSHVPAAVCVLDLPCGRGWLYEGTVSHFLDVIAVANFVCRCLPPSEKSMGGKSVHARQKSERQKCRKENQSRRRKKGRYGIGAGSRLGRVSIRMGGPDGGWKVYGGKKFCCPPAPISSLFHLSFSLSFLPTFPHPWPRQPSLFGHGVHHF